MEKNAYLLTAKYTQLTSFRVFRKRFQHSIWKKRPLSDELMHTAACDVVYLQKLYGYMVHDILLKPMENVTIAFMNTFATNLDQVDFHHQCSTNRAKGISDIDGACLDSLANLKLPTEN